MFLGATNLSFPDELLEFEVWCIATSNALSLRSQIVDLAENGYTAQVLDSQRPPIKTYEWSVSKLTLTYIILNLFVCADLEKEKLKLSILCQIIFFLSLLNGSESWAVKSWVVSFQSSEITDDNWFPFQVHFTDRLSRRVLDEGFAP